MTVKEISFYCYGWICSDCKFENEGDTSNCAKCEKPFSDKDECFDEERMVSFPAKWKICICCSGEGSTYLGLAAKNQPAFTREDFDYEGPEFYEDYMRGNYDAQCPECKGLGKIKEIDERAIKQDSLLALNLKFYLKELQMNAEFEAEYEAERGMGC